MTDAPIIERYQVRGMTCGHCVQAVTEELSRLDGVQSVDVDLDSGTATVTSSGGVDPVQVRDAVDEAGYELAS